MVFWKVLSPSRPTKTLASALLLLVGGGLLFAASESSVPPLPDPVSNNAVAILKVRGDLALYSFMGIGAKKTWDSVTTEAYSLDAGSGKAFVIHPVPGTAGRIGAMAVGAAGRVFLFGGYVLYGGGGMAVPDQNVYEPIRDRWSRGSDMPLAVGDAVIGVYRDRFIYLIGGRANGGLVSSVQVFDLEKNRWSQATSLPGTPVFGHAGGLVGDTIVYVDGAGKNPAGNSPKFVASDECWKGTIDHHNPGRIEWVKLPSHPGTAHFRIAAGASERDEKIYFVGGSDAPYDYSGMGYDGKAAEPSPVSFAFNVRTDKWEILNENTPDPTMDHRGLLVTREGLVLIGGMEKGQQVTARVTVLPKTAKPK